MGHVPPGLSADDRGRNLYSSGYCHEAPAKQLQLENIASIMFCIGILFSKLSILSIFIKVFVPFHEGLIYWVNQLLIYTNVMFYVGALVVLLLQCIPRAKISTPMLPGHCIDVYLFVVISGAWNVVSDFVILAFPVWAIWYLNMPLNRRLGIGILFGTGALYVHLLKYLPDV
jgi:hypothetical protein